MEMERIVTEWVQHGCWWENIQNSLGLKKKGFHCVSVGIVKVHSPVRGCTVSQSKFGLHNKALSTTQHGLNMLQNERGRDAKAHMHILTTWFFHCHEWWLYIDSPHSCQIVRAKTSHNKSSIQHRGKKRIFPHTEPPERSVCKSTQSFRESKETQRLIDFPKNSRNHVPFSPSCGL